MVSGIEFPIEFEKWQGVSAYLKGTIYEKGMVVNALETPLSWGIEVRYPNGFEPTHTTTVVVEKGGGGISTVADTTLSDMVWRGRNKAQRCNHYNWQDLHSLEQGHFFNPENRGNGFKGRVLSVYYREKDGVLVVRHSSANYDGQRRYGVRLVDIFGESKSMAFTSGEYTSAAVSKKVYSRLAYTNLVGGDYQLLVNQY